MELIKLYMGILFTICLIICVNATPNNADFFKHKIPTYAQNYCPLGIEVCDFKGNVRVNNILEFTPAYKSGIEKGDKILEINGIKINNIKDYKNAIQNLTDEEKYKLTIYRVDSCSKFFVEIPTTPFRGEFSES